MRKWMVLGASGASMALLGTSLVGARRRRLLHPAGRTFAGEVRVWGLPAALTGADLIDHPGVYPATVRVSKGAATPAGWPDVLGMAVRLTGAGGQGPFDLLLSTSGRGRLSRHVPLPRRSFASHYGSVLSLRTGAGRRVHLAAVPDPESADVGDRLDTVAAAADAGRACFLLAVAYPDGGWWPFGRLVFGAALPSPVDATLAFDPTRHRATDLYPAGVVQATRGLTYRVLQRWRAADTATR